MSHTEALEHHRGFRPKKRLGQHFLVDPEITKEIIARAGFGTSDLVLEIGPGLGALTLPVARSVFHVVAVEKDGHLAELLGEKLSRSGITNVTIINRDILKWNLSELEDLGSGKIQVIGNLPYNISSPFLEKLVESRKLVSRAVLMFQLEVAKRLTASPGEKAYGAMSLLIRYHALSSILLEVSREAFYPRPKVDSMVLELDFNMPYIQDSFGEAGFRKVVKGAFAHRRKTLLNSIQGSIPDWDREVLLKAMKTCGIDPGRRAETLHMDEFLCLSSKFDRNTGR